jgi:HlyD family secretion protein
MRKTPHPPLWVLLLFTLLTLYSCNKKETLDVPVSKVMQGTFYLDVVETGEIQAIQSIMISSPNISWRYGALKITQLVKDGNEVKIGDTLLNFDPSEIKKAIVEAEARLEMSYAELEKMKAQQQSEMEELKADYEITKLSQEISEIQFESAGYEANIKRKEIQLNLEQANIALARAKQQIDNTKKIQSEDVKQKLLSIEQDKTRLADAYETLGNLFLKSPAPGIAIINRNWSSDAKFQIGDQCWSGQPLIQLPNLNKLKATVQINEVDISKITKGLRVEIKPDAFSDSVYTGEVIAVANLAINKDGSSKIKVFPVDILIKDSGKRLLPGLSVSCRVLIKKIDNVVYLPIDAVQSKGSEEYVFLKTKKGFEKRIVETGASNTDHIIINKGLKKGDVVAMADPFAIKETKKGTETKKDKQP